ncbi:glycine, alanine and asparagine-rich protein-like [Haliotis rubra]|uniref:glycine, alanine and asparagine-rich protein-like n=1 Tax=Haliotis rubra TaxID=36100 RepID=UPI001EE61E1E|nr:glycine, alanine and asparagine-rich protein-like [Haliotis rubra]
MGQFNLAGFGQGRRPNFGGNPFLAAAGGPGLGGPRFGGLGGLGGQPRFVARGQPQFGAGGFGAALGGRGFGVPQGPGGFSALAGGFQPQPQTTTPPPTTTPQDQKKLVDMLVNVISRNHELHMKSDKKNANDAGPTDGSTEAEKKPSKVQAIMDAAAQFNAAH